MRRRLQVATVLHGDGAGGAGHVRCVVTEQRVLRTAEVDATIADGDGLLVLADQVGVTEAPRLIQGGTVGG